MKTPYTGILLTLLLLSGLMVCLTSPVQAQTYKRTTGSYVMPDVTLINQDGKRVRFKTLMESDKPVIVDFIYGTCTTICPVLSAGYSNLQKKLGADSDKVHLVSISIDPENDTPKVMKEYLKRYRAKPGWDFLSGSRKDIDRVMNAFDSYFRNKMDHKALTFIRTPSDGKWIRLYGLINSSEFYAECQKAGIK